MSFVAILIALLLERFFDCSHLRQWGWYTQFQTLMTKKLPGQSPYVLMAACVLPVFFAVGILGFLIQDAVFGFVKLGLAVVLLLYGFGPRNLWADIYACANALSDSDAQATEEKLKKNFNVTDLSGPQQTQKQLLNHIFIQSNMRVFAIVFWYSILGLVGVVLYRLIVQLIPESDADAPNAQLASSARLVEGYLNWPAIRFLTFLFALGGNFTRVFAVWRTKVLLGVETNDYLLAECGNAALNTTNQDAIPVDGSAEKETVSLLDRSFGIMLAIIWVMVFVIP